jgi:hypothetical protein
MSSRGKKKTTMAKLNRESRLRERKQDKQARKDARRQAALNGETQPIDDGFGPDNAELGVSDAELGHGDAELGDEDRRVSAERSNDTAPVPLS